MRATEILAEIRSLPSDLPDVVRAKFWKDIVRAGGKFGLLTHSAVILCLCNSDSLPQGLLMSLSEVLARYRSPLINTSYNEIFKDSDFELAFYSISVKRDGEWVRVPRNLNASSYIAELRSKEPVYVLHTVIEAREWFLGWSGVAVIRSDLFADAFCRL